MSGHDGEKQIDTNKLHKLVPGRLLHLSSASLPSLASCSRVIHNGVLVVHVHKLPIGPQQL